MNEKMIYGAVIGAMLVAAGVGLTRVLRGLWEAVKLEAGLRQAGPRDQEEDH